MIEYLKFNSRDSNQIFLNDNDRAAVTVVIVSGASGAKSAIYD